MNNLEQNYYSTWLTTDKLLENNFISVIDNNTEINTIGLPIGSINDKIIVDNNIDNTLVIGGSGSGKVQSVVMPMLEQAIRCGESLIVTDSDNSLYLSTSKKFQDNGYNIINLNLKKLSVSNNWNPFYLINKLYNENNKDDAYRLLNNNLKYLLDEVKPNSDPFWANTASQYLTGIIISLIDKKVDINKLNFNTLTKFTTEYTNEDVAEYLDNLDRKSVAYKNIAPTVLAPFDTKGSIMSVLNQKLTEIIGREDLVSRLSYNDFDISNIRKEKTIIYLTYDCTNSIDCSLSNILIEQILYVLNNDNIKKPYVLLLDEFDYNQRPIVDLNNKLDRLRRVYGQTVLFIKGFELINRIYGKEEVEILKYQVNNMLYLVSNELDTLRFLSEFCGRKNSTEYLVSPEALRRMPMWSSLYIKSRIMPFYSNLIPFYKMNIELIQNEYQVNEIKKVDLIDLENL